MYDMYDENGFEVYRKFMAMKNHFTSEKYDYFKYNKKIRVNFENFKTRKDKFAFNKLSSILEYEDVLLANVVKDPKVWITDISSDEGMRNFREWKKIQDSITRKFKEDLTRLDQDSFEKNFKVLDKQPPIVVKLALRSDISFETFTILQEITGLYGYWKDNVNDPVLTPKISFKAKKYHPFLTYDRKKMLEAMDCMF